LASRARRSPRASRPRRRSPRDRCTSGRTRCPAPRRGTRPGGTWARSPTPAEPWSHALPGGDIALPPMWIHEVPADLAGGHARAVDVERGRLRAYVEIPLDPAVEDRRADLVAAPREQHGIEHEPEGASGPDGGVEL